MEPQHEPQHELQHLETPVGDTPDPNTGIETPTEQPIKEYEPIEIIPVKWFKLTKKRLIVIIVLAVLVIGAAGFVIFSQLGGKPVSYALNDPEGDFDNADFDTESAVNVTSSGFSTQTILVKPHTRIDFVNQDSKNHTLFLNDPSEADGPARSKKNNPLLPNNAVIFAGGGVVHVFEKPGSYAFHLSDIPTANITVTVSK